MIKRTGIERWSSCSNPTLRWNFLCCHGIDASIRRTYSASETASCQSLRDGLRGFVDKKHGFGRPGAILGSFGLGRNFFGSNGPSGSSGLGLLDAFMPGYSVCRQFSAAGRSDKAASALRIDYAFSELEAEEKEKVGGPQRMNSTTVADSDCEEFEGRLTNDCTARNDAVMIQRILKTYQTRKEREAALDQCGVMLSEALVMQVLYRHKNDWQPALFFFVWASRQPGGYSHGAGAYNAMLNILGKMKRFHTMWQLVKEMHGCGNSPSLVTDHTFTILMRRYTAAHMVERAIETFYKREEFGLKLDTPAFQTLLGALCRYKHVQEAEALFHLRENEFPPDMKSRNIILNGWCVLGNLREARKFWNDLIKQGHKPDLFTYSTFINALTKKGKLHAALKLFGVMWDKGCIPDVPICNTILDSLCLKKRIPEALNIFGEMNERGCLPDVATYNSLIKHICNIGRMDKAYELLNEMEQKGCIPNVRTYHYFLRVMKNPEDAFKVLQRMMASGCMPMGDTYNMMLKMFLDWNEYDRALALWDDMERKGMGPDGRSYTVMIHGLYGKGKLDEAYKYFHEMTKKGLSPEPRTKILVKAIEIKAEESKLQMHETMKNTKNKKHRNFSGKVKNKVT